MSRKEFLNKLKELIDKYEFENDMGDIIICEVNFCLDDKSFWNCGNMENKFISIPEPIETDEPENIG